MKRLSWLCWFLLAQLALANPFSGPLEDTDAVDAGVPGFVGSGGDGAISGVSNYLNRAFAGWAAGVYDYAPAPGVAPQWTNQALALGPVSGNHFDVVSLGDLDAGALDGADAPGSLTLWFDLPISDEVGPDLVVYENGFLSGGDDLFGELGYVEVSSDSTNFVRFSSVSYTSNSVPPFFPFDVRAVFNLCGKHVNGGGQSWGTPFDLADVANDPLVLDGTVDLSNILFVRIVDIPGRGDFLDGAGRPIFDPWMTVGSGGLDIEAVGAINSPLFVRVTTQVIGPGAIAPYGMPAGVVSVALNDGETFTITPNGGESILDVVLDGLSLGPTNRVVLTNLTQDHALRAIFGSVTTNGVPVGWFGLFGLTEADELLDSDGDGMAAWEEYYAGTAPDDGASRLRVDPCGAGSGSNGVMWLDGRLGSTRPYIVEACTNLYSGWQILEAQWDRSPTGTNVWWDPLPGRQKYYRIRVDTE